MIYKLTSASEISPDAVFKELVQPTGEDLIIYFKNGQALAFSAAYDEEDEEIFIKKLETPEDALWEMRADATRFEIASEEELQKFNAMRAASSRAYRPA